MLDIGINVSSYLCMNKLTTGDVFRTHNSQHYLIVIGRTASNDATYVLKASYKHCLPSGGEVLEIFDTEPFFTTYNDYYYSHNIDVSGWLEFKQKQMLNALKGK